MNDIIKKIYWALIDRLNDDMYVLNHSLKRKYKKREEVDLGQMFDSSGDEVVSVETHHIDLEIEYLKGSIRAHKHIEHHITQLIKDNIDNL
tara:strand:+ start:309 stop:581 length:273 start_codon:yes stop_codon:yes gene_type:complete